MVHTKKRHIKQTAEMIRMCHAGETYLFPRKIIEKYRTNEEQKSISAEDVFAGINKKYTKPGALLRGVRARDDLTQADMAKKIKVTQSDISQMENGTRKIGPKIAKRIEKFYGVDYRSFLE